MPKMAIISIDGHVRAPRAGYREYFDQRHLKTYDDWVAEQERQSIPDAGNVKPGLEPQCQWDSAQRLENLEREGVVAEVLFPNGLPFSTRRFEDAGRADDPDLDRHANLAYNRWLADFCAEAPGRRSGQAVVTFDDIDLAVADIHWAKEHGLGGIMMPALFPGGRAFFDPALDPVWAACEEAGLPISQHGGAGTPTYQPPGFAAIMTLAIEQQFYAGRSLWQMILGGVFDRFPGLHLAFVETGAGWIAPAIRDLDVRMTRDDDWMAFAKLMQRERAFTRLASEYWTTNCHMGLSPFTMPQFDEGVEASGAGTSAVTPDTVMYGVDFPHFESTTFETMEHVTGLLRHPDVDAPTARRILYENAAEVYHFDLATLEPHIERVGFDPDDLLTPTTA
jgi:predicted TIM-barrel fold metal-dependent hydrolase